MVNAGEVRDDDGDRKGDDQDTGQGADAAYQLAQHRVGHHVTVPGKIGSNWCKQVSTGLNKFLQV